MSLDVFKHFLFRHTVGVSFGIEIVNEVIGSVTHFALLTVKERIGEAGNMTARLPHSRVHKDIGVNLIAVLSLLDKTLSPGVLNIVFQPCAERAVIPCVCKTAVDVAACKNEASVLAKSNDLIHCFFSIR